MRKTLSLILVLLLALALMLYDVNLAQAVGTIATTPNSGPWGTLVTVSGTGFTAGENVTITYDVTVVTTTPSPITASLTGTWSATITIPPPTAVTSYGPKNIVATGATSLAAAPQTFTVSSPSVSVSRTSGPVGAAVTVSGSGFGVNEGGITVIYDSTSIPVGTANAQGTWIATIAIPVSAGGGVSHTIKASGATTQASSISPQTFTVIPGISISRTTGASGTSITVNGSGFAAGEGGIAVTYDGTAIVQGITAAPEGTWTSTASTPASSGGAHNIGAYGLTTQAFSVQTVTFTVSPSISTSKASGAPGTSITVTGSGFSPGEAGITVTYDGAPVALGISANNQGTWSANFATPPSIFGSHSIRAFGSLTQVGNVAEVGFTTQGGIVLSRTSGAPGSSITVNGSGFNASEGGITVTYDGTAVASGISASPQGAWNATFTVPPSTSGSHTVRAYGFTTQSSSVGEVSFSIQGGIVLSRNSGTSGTSITVNGSGFGPGEGGITVTFDGAPVASGLTANSQGAWSANFNVPPSTSGPHSIKASGSVTQAASVGESSFSILPNISLGRAGAAPGSSVTISGSGFGPGESGIIVTYDGTPVASGISATAQGSWSATITIPSSAAGSHSLKASGSTTQAASAPEVSLSINSSISLSRTNATPGTSITINGSGFNQNETGITVTYDGNPVASGISANAQGAWTATFTVPQSISGSHSIRASGSATQATSTSEVSLSISPSMSLSRTSAAPGISINITGSGFGPNESGITVTYDGNPVASGITANAQGSWTATFAIPPSTSGLHSIRASGSATQATSAPEVNLSISPSISTSRNSAAPGTSLNITGSGFGPNESGITVTYDGNPVASGISASAQGNWSATFTIPQSASGAHSIKAFGSATQATIAPEVGLSVSPSISISRTSGAPGTSVTITGSGFGFSETGISVTYDSTQVASGISANAQGSWTTALTIPQSTFGSHSIKANGPITQTVSIGELSFNIVPVVTLNPSSGNVSSKVDITGAGFIAKSNLKFFYDDTDIPGSGDVTDTSGNFSKSFVIPRSKTGVHNIRVEDSQRNEAKASFSMESTPPPLPRLLSPGNSSSVSIVGNSTPTFRWSDVTDTSGVNYVLQIDISPEFSQPNLEKSGLSASSYTLTKDEALPRGEYYWRVQAIDGASNQSGWTQPWLMKSGLMSLWTLLILILVGVGVVVAAVYYLLLRRPVKREAPVPQPAAPVIQAYWREIEATTDDTSKPRMLPWGRKALPAPSKAAKAIPPEDHARLKIMADFAQSLPLAEPGHSVEWLVELVETATGEKPSPEVYEQLLQGRMVVPYQPAWTNHPLYLEMRSLLEGQPILQELDTHVDSVGRCASDSLSLLQDIYRDTVAGVSTDLIDKGGWAFISAIYTDANGWFRGKSLREPSERDYVIKVADGPDGEPNVVWLYGGETSSFPGPLIQALDEKDAERLRALHQKLRRNYRNNDKAKQLVGIITQIQVQRLRLLNALGQFGHFPEAS